MTALFVRKDDLRTIEVREQPMPEPAKGQAVLAVERFAMTANNVTYGVIGEQFAYWNFFPAADGWGRIPVWGYATVAASRHDALGVGERVYGYLPMGGAVLIEPDGVGPVNFDDRSAHRRPMAALYNRYARIDGSGDDLRPIFEPLFSTGWLIEDTMRRADWHGAGRAILTSASSKTALALAHAMRAGSPRIERVGLTSPGNRGFVERSGLYDRVLAYHEIETLGDAPAVSVDFAGDGPVLARIHHALGEALQFSSIVGVTHWQQRGGQGQAALPGPSPVVFFAPHAAQALIAEIGGPAFGERRGTAFDAFTRDAAQLIAIERIEGADAVGTAWRALVEGEARPDRGLIASL